MTIRLYALEKLAGESERDKAERRHATYFRDIFPRSALASSDGASGNGESRRFREIDNVRAALEWCFSAGGDRRLGVDLTIGYGLGLAAVVAATGGGLQSLDLLTKALDAAESLDDLDAQAQALAGLITHHRFRGEHDRTHAAAQRLFQVAGRLGDAALRCNAGRLMGTALVMLGRPREARGLLESYLNADRSIANRRSPPLSQMEDRALAHAHLSRALWMLGFIDQARREAEASLDELRATDHPLQFCRVSFLGLCRILPTTGDFAASEQSITRVIETATRIGARFWQISGHLSSGSLMIERGQFAQGVAVLNDAFDARRQNGWRTSYPEFKGALATGLAGLGQLDEALAAVNEGLDGAVHGERGYDPFFAELLRIKGEILVRRGAMPAAEDLFAQAIDIARRQEALFWELRASLSLARLRVAQGRGGEARQLVTQVYDRFTEGFGTPDLRAAKVFLDELPG